MTIIGKSLEYHTRRITAAGREWCPKETSTCCGYAFVDCL